MKKYFYVLNRIFHKLNYREKFLLLLFTSTLTFIWFMSACQQTKTLVQNWHTINTKIKQDRFWIRNESIVKANLRKVLDVMDPGKTLSGAAFSGEVENIIRAFNLNYSITSPKTHQGEIFNSHSLQLHCTGASIGDLITVEEAIYAKKPYLNLEKVKIHANSFNPEQLEVDFSLSALQLQDIPNENR